MKNRRSNRWVRFLSAAVAATMMLTLAPAAKADEVPESENTVLINEIESSDADGGNDWVEIINVGDTAVDISGWFLTDDGGLDRLTEGSALPISENTVLEPGEVLVLEENTDFTFGLGKADTVTLYNADSRMMDTYSWTAHAAGTYSRVPGSSEFVDQAPTKGAPNIVTTDPEPDPEPEVPEEEPKPDDGPVVINEVESNGDITDWVEIYNRGETAVDISGWYLLDNDPEGHAEEVTPVEEGTILEPGAFFVFDQKIHFTFGLGSADQVTIFDKDGTVVAEFAWKAHAEVVYARVPDGTGELAEYGTATKGASNKVKNPVVNNEVQSSDPDGGPDWIELANPTDAELDISGIVIKDSDDTHGYAVPEGTVIPAGEYWVVTEDDFGFGLGKNDAVRLFEEGVLIAETTWEGNTDPTWGLYPDIHGTDYRSTAEATPGTANKFPEPPHTHDYAAVVTAPTCVEEGYTTYTCIICGDTYKGDITAPNGQHTYQDDTDTTCDVCGYVREIEPEQIETVPMYRLYNPNSGEHFYTGSEEERNNLQSAGWNYESVAWNAPVYIGEPVFRMFNPNSGDHHYTMSLEEVENLKEAGWQYENVAWNSAPADHAESVPQYRLYNPNADLGCHSYTSSLEEQENLINAGWLPEGIGWFGLIK